jgi:hypothetical protein
MASLTPSFRTEADEENARQNKVISQLLLGFSALQGLDKQDQDAVLEVLNSGGFAKCGFAFKIEREADRSPTQKPETDPVAKPV